MKPEIKFEANLMLEQFIMNFSNLERFSIHLVLFWKICNKSLKCQIGFKLDFWFHNMRFNFWRGIKLLIELCGVLPHPPMKSLFNQMARNFQTLPKPHDVLAMPNSSKLGLEGLCPQNS